MSTNHNLLLQQVIEKIVSMTKLESIHLYGFKFGFKCFFFLDIIICSRVKYFFFFIRVRSMLDLSSTFKLLICFNLQCEFFSHYYMIFCFSNYQNYSLVLFYLNAMFKWAFTFNQCNLSFTWGMRIMANTHTGLNYPIEIWHVLKPSSLGFLFLSGSHLPPKFPQLKRVCKIKACRYSRITMTNRKSLCWWT